MIKVSLFCL